MIGKRTATLFAGFVTAMIVSPTALAAYNYPIQPTVNGTKRLADINPTGFKTLTAILFSGCNGSQYTGRIQFNRSGIPDQTQDTATGNYCNTTSYGSGQGYFQQNTYHGDFKFNSAGHNFQLGIQ